MLLKISIWDVPLVDETDRLTITELDKGFFSVRAVYGFTEKVDINAILKIFNEQYHFVDDLLKISIFAPRVAISTSPNGSMPLWRQKLFAWLVQNETQAVDFYDINLSCVVQMGSKFQL